ncbi:unnamed protein product [Arabidopsis arenosa]|uniref:NHL domain-containing protein n=1 Tax=Arabidopsis arenosa TaxID=38785 RepID=A0A8S1ZF35_ARAAE|nr:unnamed protein product [Arabidopsis arenosa]
MAWGFSSVSLFLFVVFNLVSAKIVLEDGYEVTTVVDGHKSGLNPYTIHALPGSSNLIVLDSSGSTFYTTSFPLSVDSVINRFAGDGTSGYVDGKAGNSRFNKTRGFAIDAKGNVYVADKNNKAIRKISSSGYVTTIAGGISKEFGHRDGPAQNATFSSDFEITFVPQRCCLLVSDHGNEMVRQINLKEEDCLESSHSNLGTYSLWSIGIVLSCILGVAIGFAVRPYIIRHTGRSEPPLVHHDMEASPNQIGGTSSDLLLLPILDKTCSVSDPKSPGCGNPKPPLSLKPSDDHMDLISFDDEQEPDNDKDCSNEETLPHATIDDIIKVHVEGFSKMAEEDAATHGSSITE